MSFRNNLKKSYWIGVSALYISIILGIVFFERQDETSNIKTIIDGFWFTIVTITTVGYGDFYPVTLVGRILSLVIILSSLGLLGVFIGKISNIFLVYMEKRKQGYYGTEFKKHFVVIGWNPFSKQVADQMVNANRRVAIVTNNINDLDLIKDIYSEKMVFVLFSDFNNYESLNKVNISEANTVFVNIGDDTKTLVYTIGLQKLYDLEIVVAPESGELKETFKSVGVSYVISKNTIASRLVASYIFEPDVASFTEDLMETSVDKDDYDMQQYKIVENSTYLNKEYFEAFIELKKKYDCVLVALLKNINGERVLLKNPKEGTIIELDNYMILISSKIGKIKIEKELGIKEGIL